MSRESSANKRRYGTRGHAARSQGVLSISGHNVLRQRPANLLVEALENTVLYGIPHDPLLALCAEDYENLQAPHSCILALTLLNVSGVISK